MTFREPDTSSLEMSWRMVALCTWTGQKVFCVCFFVGLLKSLLEGSLLDFKKNERPLVLIGMSIS